MALPSLGVLITAEPTFYTHHQLPTFWGWDDHSQKIPKELGLNSYYMWDCQYPHPFCARGNILFPFSFIPPPTSLPSKFTLDLRLLQNKIKERYCLLLFLAFFLQNTNIPASNETNQGHWMPFWKREKKISWEQIRINF